MNTKVKWFCHYLLIIWLNENRLMSINHSLDAVDCLCVTGMKDVNACYEKFNVILLHAMDQYAKRQ